MELSSDFKDIFKIFNKYKVKYLLIGAYAVIYYTEPRFTKDIDIWVKPDIKNAEKVYKSLSEFGAPLRNIKVNDFTNKKMIYQIGVAPVRIDIIIGTTGMKFDSAWEKRKKSFYDKVSVNIISRKDLIKIKTKLKRKQDILDIEKLREKS